MLRFATIVLTVTTIYIPAVLYAQQGVEVSIAGIAGINNVNPGDEILIYAVQLRDTVDDNRRARLASGAGEGIVLTLSDLTTPTGVAAADFTGLNLYRSTDALLDGGDTFIKTIAPVNIGATTLVDFQAVGNPNRSLPDPGEVPDRIFFLVSATIAPGATAGHAFRLGTAVNHIDMRDSGGGAPTDYNIGSAIAAADGNRVVIAGAASGLDTDHDTPIEIPFGGEWLFALGGLACGLYALYMRR